MPERRAALDAIAIHATTLRIPVVEVEGGTLTALCGFDGHQGVALVAKPRPPADPATILARARERNEAPFILVIDSLEDPQNFGTLLRSAEAVGAHGVIYPTRRAAPLSPSAIKASAGATEHLVLAAVEDLAGTLADLHGQGVRLVGADETASLDYSEADLRGPLAIVVGSEGRGISGTVRKRLDLTVRIPMRGKIGSLNASVAGSILLFAAAAQHPPGTAAKSTSVDPEVEEPADGPAPKPKRAARTVKKDAQPDKAAKAAKAAQPAKPATPVKPAKPSKPAKAATPGSRAKPTKKAAKAIAATKATKAGKSADAEDLLPTDS